MIRDSDGNVGTLFDAEKSGQVSTTAPYLVIQDGWTSLQETIWEINDKEEDGCGGDARGPPSFPGLVALDTTHLSPKPQSGATWRTRTWRRAAAATPPTAPARSARRSTSARLRMAPGLRRVPPRALYLPRFTPATRYNTATLTGGRRGRSVRLPNYGDRDREAGHGFRLRRVHPRLAGSALRAAPLARVRDEEPKCRLR